jgi:hypothetical protein
MYLGVLFLYPNKASFVIVGLPFILILVLHRSNQVLAAVAALTLIGCFIGVDIFRERMLVRPYATAGTYAVAVCSKPYYRLGYLRRLITQHEGEASAVVCNAWGVDFIYNIDRGRLALTREQIGVTENGPVFSFHPQNGERGVLLSREVSTDANLLAGYRARGYGIKMDRYLYRNSYLKYQVTEQLGGTGKIGEIPVDLFEVDESALP